MDENKRLALFASRLNALRQAKKQSARDMSLSLGFAPNYINGLEAGKNYPAMGTFFYICDHFGIAPSEFFDYEDAYPKLTSELYREIQKMDNISREYFLYLIKAVNNRPRQ